MFKPGEKTAYTRFSADAYEIQKRFPWNQDDIGYYLASMGAIMSLLPNPPLDLLDAGCGVGFTSRILAMRGYRVTGIDINTELLKIGSENRWHNESERLQWVEHDYEETFRPNAFDAVVFFDSLHHSMQPHRALQMAFSSLKQGGVCVAVEPGVGHSISPTAQKFAKEMDVTENSTPPYKVARLGKQGLQGQGRLSALRHCGKNYL